MLSSGRKLWCRGVGSFERLGSSHRMFYGVLS